MREATGERSMSMMHNMLNLTVASKSPQTSLNSCVLSYGLYKTNMVNLYLRDLWKIKQRKQIKDMILK